MGGHNTFYIVECDGAVREFINQLDMIISDLGWSPEVWIMGYNKYYHDDYGLEELIDWYRGIRCRSSDSYNLGLYEQDLTNMARLAISSLYPAMRQIIDPDDTGTMEVSYIRRLSLTGYIRCSLYVGNLSNRVQVQATAPSPRISSRY